MNWINRNQLLPVQNNQQPGDNLGIFHLIFQHLEPNLLPVA